jgi:hypothetical protein
MKIKSPLVNKNMENIIKKNLKPKIHSSISKSIAYNGNFYGVFILCSFIIGFYVRYIIYNNI